MASNITVKVVIANTSRLRRGLLNTEDLITAFGRLGSEETNVPSGSIGDVYTPVPRRQNVGRTNAECRSIGNNFRTC